MYFIFFYTSLIFQTLQNRDASKLLCKCMLYLSKLLHFQMLRIFKIHKQHYQMMCAELLSYKFTINICISVCDTITKCYIWDQVGCIEYKESLSERP